MKIWTILVYREWFSESDVLVFTDIDKATKKFNELRTEHLNECKENGWNETEIQEEIDNKNLEDEATHFYSLLLGGDNAVGFELQEHELN
jgi:hypothetical protein